MKIVLNVLAALFLSVAAMPVQAQTTKLGHANITKVLQSMPGYQAAEKKLEEFAMQLQETLSTENGHGPLSRVTPRGFSEQTLEGPRFFGPHVRNHAFDSRFCEFRLQPNS